MCVHRYLCSLLQPYLHATYLFSTIIYLSMLCLYVKPPYPCVRWQVPTPSSPPAAVVPPGPWASLWRPLWRLSGTPPGWRTAARWRCARREARWGYALIGRRMAKDAESLVLYKIGQWWFEKGFSAKIDRIPSRSYSISTKWPPISMVWVKTTPRFWLE